MRTPLACLWLLLAHLPAQVVHAGNLGASPYDGWVRATIDTMPKHKAGITTGGVTWVLGREIGRDVRTVDLRLHLEPGDLRSIDLTESRALEFRRGALPSDEIGLPRIAGRELAPVSIVEDGAGYLVHLRARTGRLLCSDLWLVWYPGQAWARGEVVVTASNPAVPDVVETIPGDGLTLSWPDGLVLLQGAPAQGAGLLLAGSETLADGQARAWPLTVAWPARLGEAGPAGVSGWSSAGAAATGGIVALGIERLWPEGWPLFRGDPVAFGNEHAPACLAALSGWRAARLGVLADSGSTGAQEDQVFVGGELQYGTRSLACVLARYYAALGQLRRPCHHLEATGDLLAWDAHPDLVIWTGRPHLTGRDQLGKPRQPTLSETHGWRGPDREHWLQNTVAIALRITGSPALEWEMGAQARLFWWQETVDRRLSTSGYSTERSVGWAGILAVHLDRSLPRRDAERIAVRWRERVTRVYLPQLAGKPLGVWKPNTDPRLQGTGCPVNWMPYQQGVGCFGLDYGCKHLGPAEGRAFALQAAKATLAMSFDRDPAGRWRGWGYVAVDVDAGTTGPLVEGEGAHWGSGVEVWHTWTVATIVAHEPAHEPARAILDQFVREGHEGLRWVPAGVR